jgi:4-hydroxy-4-methyl-2-oxoglutarate aldolase
MDSNSLTNRLQKCYTGAVYDVLRSMGMPKQALPYEIRPIDLNHTIAGEVFTIEGRLEKNITEHESLLQWCGFLSKAPSGKIVMCQPNDATIAHMGELSSETLVYKNVLGYIVDGGCRDSGFIQNLGFPVFCKYFTPVDVVGKWAAFAFEKPIVIGDVTIHNGDYVIADRDGVIIIPKAHIEEVVTKTEEVMGTENLVRKAILQGTDPVEAYLTYGKF